MNRPDQRPRRTLPGGVLDIDWEPRLKRLLAQWLPRANVAPTAADRGLIEVRSGPLATPRDAPVLLRLGTATAAESDDGITITDRDGLVSAVIDPTRMNASVRAAPDINPAAEPPRWAMFFVLTLASALLLTRRGRPLIHAGAIVDPHTGSAWLLVGDTHAGKSTTVASLVDAGWNYLSDDHLVVWDDGDGPAAAGWPRPFHLDAGFQGGEITGRRDSVDPATLGPGRLIPTAPIAGVWMPMVDPDHPTVLTRASPVEVFAALVRQSPWLLADRSGAGAIRDLFGAIAALPAFHLRLGGESYGRPAALEARIRDTIHLQVPTG